eukprot:evm.model.scf_4830.1 EVM.evm.TU.scf_4830.1   scf_4830:2495-2890(-)
MYYDNFISLFVLPKQGCKTINIDTLVQIQLVYYGVYGSQHCLLSFQLNLQSDCQHHAHLFGTLPGMVRRKGIASQTISAKLGCGVQLEPSHLTQCFTQVLALPTVSAFKMDLWAKKLDPLQAKWRLMGKQQ